MCGVLLCAVAALIAVGCGEPPPAPTVALPPDLPPGLPPLLRPLGKRWTGDLAGMHERHVVRALVSYSRTHFFLVDGRPRGFEAELLQGWIDEINKHRGRGRPQIRLVFVPRPFESLLPDLAAGYGDIAAAGLTVTAQRERYVAFTEPYLEDVDEIVVTHRDKEGLGGMALRTLDDLAGRRALVVRGSSYVESLERLDADLRGRGLLGVDIVEMDPALEIEDLLELIHTGNLDWTVADRHRAELWAKILPGIEPRPDLRVATGGAIAWAVRHGSPALRSSLDAYLRRNRLGTLLGNVLFERYYETTRWIENPLEADAGRRLRTLRPLFEKYAARYGFDWMILAALAYQESRFDPLAVSRVGAVGIMQVLPETGADPLVDLDITGLEGNIHAGARYLAWLRDEIFDDPGLNPQERLRFCLAAYNAGPTRVRRMRRRAAEMGLDPNRWFFHVEHAAFDMVGRETVHFVSKIHKYFIAYKLSEDAVRRRAEQRPPPMEKEKDI